jgi:hypothetical protein
VGRQNAADLPRPAASAGATPRMQGQCTSAAPAGNPKAANNAQAEARPPDSPEWEPGPYTELGAKDYYLWPQALLYRKIPPVGAVREPLQGIS